MSNLPNDQKALVAALPELSVGETDRIRRLVATGSSSYLSADKEVGPFMLFLLGDDIETVAVKTGIPKDILLLTCHQYRWLEKRAAISTKEGEMVKGIERSLLNNILVATYKAVSEEVGAVMAGKLKPSAAQFIPQSMQALQRLMEMVEKANQLVAVGGNPPAAGGGTVVHAQNVQINQAAPVPVDDPEERRRRYLAARASKEDE